MRWVFYALLIINLAYGGWKLTFWIMQPAVSAQPEDVQQALPKAPVTLQLVAATDVPQTGVVSKPLCASLGPWPEAAQAAQAQADLGAIAATANIASVSVQKQRLSWVYLPSFATRAQALEALKRLQAKGVDSFITKDGDADNAISLGYFGNHESALGVQQRMQQAGFNAQVRETAQAATEYWLFLDSAQPDGLAAWLEQHPQVTLGKVACQSSTSPDLIKLQAPEK